MRTFSIFAYATFVATTLWAIGFLADLRVPTTVDSGIRHRGWVALLIDAGLLLVFAVQHSVMARRSVKRHLARVLPAVAERSTYVVASSLALGLLFWQWSPLPGTLWHVSANPWATVIWMAYAFGWLVAVSATFMIDHWDFLGLRQAFRCGPDPYPSSSFRERWLYAWVRHPLMLGLLIAFWATPRMTVSHLVFALAATAYIAVGVQFEERDLRAQLGDVYRDYAQRVPALIPLPHRSKPIGPRRAIGPGA